MIRMANFGSHFWWPRINDKNTFGIDLQGDELHRIITGTDDLFVDYIDRIFKIYDQYK